MTQPCTAIVKASPFKSVFEISDEDDAREIWFVPHTKYHIMIEDLGGDNSIAVYHGDETPPTQWVRLPWVEREVSRVFTGKQLRANTLHAVGLFLINLRGRN